MINTNYYGPIFDTINICHLTRVSSLNLRVVFAVEPIFVFKKELFRKIMSKKVL